MRRILLPTLVALAACGRPAPVPPPPGVDSAGDPLPPWAIARIGTARFCGPCAGCAFSADGKSVVAACDDGFVRTFDATTGRETASFDAHRDVVKPEREGTLSRLDATFSSFGPPPDGIQHAAFSKDGTRLVTAGGPALRLWDVATGKKLAEHVRAGESQAVAFSSDGKSVRVADFDRLWSWDPDAGTFAGTPVRFSQFGFLGTLASRDAAVARPAAAGPNPNGAVVTDVGTGAEVVLAAPFFAAGCGESPDGTRVAVLGTSMGNARQSPIVVCDAQTGAVLASATIDDSCWGSVSWTPDATTLAFAGSAVVHLARASTLADRSTIPLRMAPVAAFSSDGNRLLLDTWTGPRVFDVATGEEAIGAAVRVRGGELRWSANGRAVALRREDGNLSVFDAATGLPTDVPAPQPPRSARFGNGRVTVVDAATGAALIRPSQQMRSFALSPSGRWLVAGTDATTVVLTDVVADRDVTTWTTAPLTGSAVAVSDAPARAVVAYARGVAVLEESRSRPLREWDIEARWDATDVAITADGRLVAAVVGWDVVVWDVDEDEEVVRLAGHRAPPSDLEFSPDGTHLVSASADGTALVWALPPRSR